MNSVRLTFQTETPEQADILTALLSEHGLEGTEESGQTLIAYFPAGTFHEEEILEAVGNVAPLLEKHIIEPQNWNATWESNFEPIRINHQVNIRAHFHPPATDALYDLLITPKMSFGTGHHETTRMMLEFLCETDCSGKSVLDFGCGTGVLAILAKRKNAGRTVGIDHDDWSVDNALENCRLNDCADIHISKQTLDDLAEPFDLIVANINLNVLLETLPRLYELLNSGGDLFLSGILNSDGPAMEEAINRHSFHLMARKSEKNWLALHIRKNNI